MNAQQDERRQRISGKRVLLFAVVVLVIAFTVIPFIGRALFASWSIGFFGRDTLTGDWVGTVQARQGAEYGLYLRLEYKGRGSSNSRSSYVSGTTNLKGRATLCTPVGERIDYEVMGKAGVFGDVESLRLEYDDPLLSALNLRLSGDWDAPTLTLESETNPFLPDGSFDPDRVLSSDDPDDAFGPIELAKGDREDLEPVCTRIQQQ